MGGGRSDSESRRSDRPATSPSIAPPRAEGTVTLSDDRVLGYAEYGPAEGYPLFVFHGMPGSRYTRPPDTAPLDAHGVRQITLERPGYGRSTLDPDRTLLDWPDDVRAVADALDVERFAVAGYSAGGPHALACAVAIPDRLTGVGVISGVGPWNDALPALDLPLRTRVAIRLSRVPLLPRVLFWPAVRRIRSNPEAAIEILGSRFSDADRALLDRPAVRALVREDVSEAVQQGGRGWAQDASVLAQPWGFDLSAVDRHVDLWHGERDPVVPVEVGQYVAGALPDCTARYDPDAGHLLVLEHFEEILDALLPE